MFKNIAYSKVNLDYDKDVFIKEYDEIILPNSTSICNSLNSIKETEELNKIWNMIDPDEYNNGDYFTQDGDATTYRNFKRQRHQWKMLQLLRLDTVNITDELLLSMADFGGPSLRNETLDPKYTFNIKPEYEHLKIWEWIKSLPFEKINSVHCVSLEEGDMATIHRDEKGLYDNGSSATNNKVYNNGYVVLCINLSNGGVPLYWSLDKDQEKFLLADDDLYLINDFFLHGVPICTSRRRQIRITGIPKPELYNLLDKSSIIKC